MQYKPHNVHLKTKKKNEYLAQTNTAIYIYINYNYSHHIYHIITV